MINIFRKKRKQVDYETKKEIVQAAKKKHSKTFEEVFGNGKPSKEN